MESRKEVPRKVNWSSLQKVDAKLVLELAHNSIFLLEIIILFAFYECCNSIQHACEIIPYVE